MLHNGAVIAESIGRYFGILGLRVSLPGILGLMMISLLQKLFPATTIDHSTRSANPGNFQINYWTYFRFFPAQTFRRFGPLWVWLKAFLVLNLLYWGYGYWFVTQMLDAYSVNYSDLPIMLIGPYLLFGLWLNVAFFKVLPKALRSLGYWLNHLREHFIFGSVSQAIVVSQSPPLVAVATDLRKWDESYPVVKILEQPLHRLPGGVPSVGTRLAAVSLYYASEDQLPHWADFEPIVVNCVTDAQADIDRVFQSLRLEDWQDLQDGLSCVRRRDQPGLYFVNSSERHVLPEGAEHEEDFAAIGELKFLDIRDVLRVDYQMGNVLRLHRGFPSARSAWDYEWAKFRSVSRYGFSDGTVFWVFMFLVNVINFSSPMLNDVFRQIQFDPVFFWSGWGLLLVFLATIPGVIACKVIYFITQPFAQFWEFDRNSGLLTVRNQRVFSRNKSTVYPLGQFQNIEISKQYKGRSEQEYWLVLQRQQQVFLWFRLRMKCLRLAEIADSTHPEVEQRLEVARQVRFTVRQFMDWLII